MRLIYERASEKTEALFLCLQVLGKIYTFVELVFVRLNPKTSIYE